MGNNKKSENKSRRSFFTSFFNGNNEAPGEKVKMLTAEGKLVEVDKNILDAAVKQKASNKEIFDWMKNPSKKNL